MRLLLRRLAPLLLLLLACLPAGAAAQRDGAPLPSPGGTARPEVAALRRAPPLWLTGEWRFFPGDHPAGADPALDDRAWTPVRACLCGADRRRPGGAPLPSAGGPSVVWLRLHLSADQALQALPLALQLHRVHGAAEVYVNGRPVLRAGDVDRPGAPLTRPAAERVVRLDRAENVVAVRLSLATAERTAERFGREQLGVLLGISPSPAGEQYLLESAVGDAAALMFFAGLCVAFGLLHLILFGFFTRPAANLWFGIYALAMALHAVVWWRRGLAPTVEEFFRLTAVISVFTWPVAAITPARFLYSVVYPRLPWHFWLLAAPHALGAACFVAAPSLYEPVAVAANLASAAGGLVLVGVALRRRIEGARLVGLGIALLVAPFVLDTLGEMHVIDASPIPYLEYYGITGLCVAMSVYLARNHARTAADLARLTQHLESEVEARTVALRASEAKYRTLIETAGDAILLVSAHTLEVRDANAAASRLTGLPRAELVGRPVTRLGAPEDGAAYRDLFRAPDGAGDAAARALHLLHASGRRVPVEVSATPAQVEGETVVQAIVRDVTERHEAQATLHRAKEAAEEASRTKSQFLANMSHELRTPLNAIVGFSEMLIEEAEELGQVSLGSDLGKIRTSGRHLLGLINDILDLSKIEAGKMELLLERVDLPALLREAAATAQPLADARGNALEVRVDPALGALRTDATKLRQILLNLLSNACKFTEAGTVRLDAEPGEGGTVVLRVRDTGIGIAPEVLPALFSPFTQADASVTRRYGGTGLGLTLTRRFAEMLGGTVEVESRAGHGTTFTVRLPVDEAEPAARATVPAERLFDGRGVLDEGAGTAGTVLLVDDDPAARELIARTLSREGFRVVAAPGAELGLALARRLRPDVITLDVRMPGMDGWELLAALKDDPALADVPVVMLTVVDDREAGVALGVANYLVKPVTRDRLLAAMARFRLVPETGPVLVVDDDPHTREVICRTLSREGWTVDEAADGRAALARAAERPPALVVLDLVMPEMDGFAFVEAFRHTPHGRDTPVVVLTSKELCEAERERLRGSVTRVLRKGPHPRGELLAEVRRLLRKRVPVGAE